jgi:hypothetical protein
MRKTSLVTATAAALTLALGIGSVAAQSQATRTIQVPAGAVVLVLPGMGAGGMMVPAQRLDAGLPMPPITMTVFDDMFRQMDAQMDRMTALAQRGFAIQPPDRVVQAALGDPSRFAGSSVVVTSFSDGRRSCTQRVTYAGNGAAPVVQTSGDGCTGGTTGLPVPATGHENMVPHAQSPRLIEAARHVPRAIEVAELSR